MLFAYYLIVILVLSLAGPVLLLQPKVRIGLKQKFGFLPCQLQAPLPEGKKRIWFHAVSVGEFNAILPLLKVFRLRHPEYHICISTTTATGQKLASEKASQWATIFFFPLDLPQPVNKWLDRINPSIVAIAETEIWPGFILQCARRNIPVCLVNGRISPKSFQKYKLLKPLFAPIFSRFAAIASQSEQESLRYLSLGAREGSVFACGNLKFDGVDKLEPGKQAQLRESLGLSGSELVVIGGSTHEGEETALLSALKALPGNARLILAPRHPERFERVAQLIESCGLRARRYSRQESFERQTDVFLLDTIGHLTSFYSIASLAFVGGTLVPVGGHNLMEPYAYAIPVVCGPHVEKTRDVAATLLSSRALVMVPDKDELARRLSELAASKELRDTLGSAGQAVLSESQGAVARTMTALEAVLYQRASDGKQTLLAGDLQELAGQASGNTADKGALEPITSRKSSNELG